jgi:DNA-binding XRE family transcriptional regulator
MKLNRIIINTRKLLKESGTTFGKRFGASHATVSQWEAGVYEAPYKVVAFCIEYLLGGKAIIGTKLGLK